jgi:uncharacterized protein with beta-barrel porin domain
MNGFNHIKKISAATVLACLGMQSANADTFSFQFSNGGVTATGSFVTTDTAAGALSGAFDTSFVATNGLPGGAWFFHLASLDVLVQGDVDAFGDTSLNRLFQINEFGDLMFIASGPLNYSSNLAGQTNLVDFNLQNDGAISPSAVANFVLRTWYGTNLTLNCLFLQGVGQCGGSGFVPLATPVSVGAAAVLDTAPAGLSQPIAALGALSFAQQRAILTRLAPETSRAVYAASTRAVNGILDTVQTRIEGSRNNGSCSSLRDDEQRRQRSCPILPTSMNDDLQQGKVMLATNGDAAGLFDAADAKKYGFWAKAFGTHGNQNQGSLFAGYTDNTYGTSFGMDTLLDNDWLLGAALTYAHTSVDMSGGRSGDDTNVKTYQITGYTSHNFGSWYVDGEAAYARQDYSCHRNTTLLGVAKGDFSGDQLAARITAGIPYNYYDMTITPVAGLEYTYLKQDGYTETGAGVLSLKVQGQSQDSIRSMFGAKVAIEKDIGNGFTMTPSLHVAWRHAFNDSGVDTTSTFTGGGAAFTTPGQKLAQDSFNAGAGLSFQKSRDFTFAVVVDGEEAAGYKAVSGQVVGQWKF